MNSYRKYLRPEVTFEEIEQWGGIISVSAMVNVTDMDFDYEGSRCNCDWQNGNCNCDLCHRTHYYETKEDAVEACIEHHNKNGYSKKEDIVEEFEL